MKLIRFSLLAAASSLLLSCAGTDKEPDPAEATPAPSSNPRPDRPPPPPQPQDGSMIVLPDGTKPLPKEIPDELPKELDDVSAETKSDALSAAEKEINKRKAGAGDSDDAVSKALKNVSDEDINKAFKELKKAVE